MSIIVYIYIYIYIYVCVCVCVCVCESLCAFVDRWPKKRSYLWHFWPASECLEGPLCLFWREDHTKSCARGNLRERKKKTKDVNSALIRPASPRSQSQLTDFFQISAHASGAWRHSHPWSHPLSGIFIVTSLNDTSSPCAREHLRSCLHLTNPCTEPKGSLPN